MRSTRLIGVLLVGALIAGCGEDGPLRPDARQLPQMKPALDHAPREASAIVDVNNFQIHLSPAFITDGYFKGDAVVFAGGLMYGNGPAAVFYYNTRSGVHWSLTGTRPVEVVAGVYADHQTLNVATPRWLRWSAAGRIVVVRETFAYRDYPDDDYVIFKYTLYNPSDETVEGLHLGQDFDLDIAIERSDTPTLSDNVVEYDAANQLAIVTSTDPPLVAGHVLLSDAVTSYRAWRSPASEGPPVVDPSTDAEWYEFLTEGIVVDPNPFGPSDIRHLLSHGPVEIPPHGSRVVFLALLGGDDRTDLLANAAAVRARYAALPAAAKQAYPAAGVLVYIEPETLNLESEGVFKATLTFDTPGLADQFNPEDAECSQAHPLRFNELDELTLEVLFERSDLDPRLSYDWIICAGKLLDGTLFIGLDRPKIIRAVAALTQLTIDPATDRTPTWSPDGRSIAFASDRAGSEGVFAIWRMDLEEGEASAVQLTDGGSDHWPHWSPDGSTIVFGRRFGPPDHPANGIYAVPAGGGSVTRLSAGDDRVPRFSPDGQQIVFRRTDHLAEPPRNDIWKMSAAGEFVGPPAIALTSQRASNVHPAWAPAGSRVYFATRNPRDDPRWAIFSVDPGLGGPAARVTPIEPADNLQPALAPKGKTLAFVSASSAGNEIILQDLKTSEHTVVVLERWVSVPTTHWQNRLEFSRNGKHILFSDGFDVYLADVSDFR